MPKRIKIDIIELMSLFFVALAIGMLILLIVVLCMDGDIWLIKIDDYGR